jgi:hypothetical protein
MPCKKKYMKHIPSCQEMKEHENDLTDFAKFKEVIPKISEEFHTRFNDFDSLKPKLHLFNNPMDPEVTQQPFDLQMELCDLQSDATFQSKKKKEPSEDFWKMLSQEKFPKLQNFSLEILSLFGSTMFVKLHFP